MLGDLSTPEIIAHAMIAILFLFRGLTAIPNFADHAGRFRRFGIPFPNVFFACGIATMLIGGMLVLLNYYAWIGATMLIVFTCLANLLYHHFWAIDEPVQKERHLYIFFNNVAVMGGLVLVMV